MSIYLLKSGILLLVFYILYKVWLENEKMFRFNRAYLLGSLIFSFIIPLQLFSFSSFFSNEINMVQLEGIIIGTNNAVLNKIDYSNIVIYILSAVYIIVSVILIFRFVLNLNTFYKKMTKNEIQIIKNQKIVLVKEQILPHSFWNTIFINAEEYKKGNIPSELIAHEKAHIQQKHTLDILFIEALQILFWFNPLIILYKKAIKLNHEFLADEAVNIQFESVSTYQNLLLNIASHKNNVALASNINYLITKKRLLMMTKKDSPVKIVFKVFTIGIIYSMLLFVFSTQSAAQQNESQIINIDTILKQPEYPGGIEEFYKLVGMNFKTPLEADKNKIEGKILIKFIIEKDGSLSDFKIIKDLGYGTGDEAVRVLKLSPKWIPGSENGKPVRVEYSMPITIETKH